MIEKTIANWTITDEGPYYENRRRRNPKTQLYRTGRPCIPGAPTAKQLKFVNRLLGQHARDYGIGPGDQLMLDSFTAVFPTSDELQKMTRQEVSNLIDMLLNDSM